MKLSKETLELLSSFSDINPNLLIKEGTKLATINESRSILATATTEETWPQDVGIYNLSEFNSTLNLFESPTLEFGKTSMKISGGSSEATYQFADASILTTPQQDIKMPKPDLTISVPASVLTTVKKAASNFKLSVISIRPVKGKIAIMVVDPMNSKANSFSFMTEEVYDGDKSFDFQFSILNLKMLPGDYTLDLAKGISRWTHKTRALQYFIALEKTSTFA